jgi:hypothetical protein
MTRNRGSKSFISSGGISNTRMGISLMGFVTHASVRNPNLHLMAVFFDVLVIDDQNLLFKSYVERTKVLSEIIIQRDGWV